MQQLNVNDYYELEKEIAQMLSQLEGFEKPVEVG